MSRFQNWFLPFFLLTFKVKVKGQRSRLQNIGDHLYVTVFGSFSVKRTPKPVIPTVDTSRQLLMRLSNDLDLPTGKVKVI